MSESTRVACLGLGRHMRNSLLPNLLADERWNLVAAADQKPEVREIFGRRFPHVNLFESAEELLGHSQALRLEALIIAADPATHALWTTKALEKNLHVFVEKPACERAESLAAPIGLARERGRVVAVGTMWRYARPTEIFEQWRAKSPSEREVVQISIIATYPPVILREGWAFNNTELAFFDMFIHPLDYCLAYMELPLRISVLGSPQHTGEDVRVVGTLKSDKTLATLSLVTGSSAYHVDTSFSLKNGDFARIEDMSRLTVNTRETWTGTPGAFRDRPELSWEHGQLYRGYARHGYAEELVAFDEAIRGGSPVRSDLTEAARSMLVLESCIDSLRSGEPVLLERERLEAITALMPGNKPPAHEVALSGHRDKRLAVFECIAEEFGSEPSSLGDDPQMGITPGWDSLGHMNLMIRIEERFDVELPVEKISKLTSAAAIVRYLEE